MSHRILAVLLLLSSCHRPSPLTPLPQRAYVWQREWTPAVTSSVRQASASTPSLQSLVIFGAEITWANGQPKALLTTIDWATLRALQKPISIAMRVAVYGGPFDDKGPITEKLATTATALLAKARAEQVPCTEFQLDFDCAQKKLTGYALWLPALRAAVKPVPFVITTLPSWLDEPAFPKLLDLTDGYILQVHSIAPVKASANALICDPTRARAWVAKAAALKRPFQVALSTYSAIAGYDANGKLLGLALDGVQPAWPAGTKLMQFESNAADIAALVHEWQTERRPAHLQGLLWYRLPVTTDQRNWRWPTFAAVLEGRSPASHLTVKQTEGANPIDLTLLNEGEAEEILDHLQIKLTWPATSPPPTTFEALPGWTCALISPSSSPSPQPLQTIANNRQPSQTSPFLLFSTSQTQRLSPGTQRGIGWLRFENQRAPLHVEIIR